MMMMTINTSKESHISFINALTMQGSLQIMKKYYNISDCSFKFPNLGGVSKHSCCGKKKQQQH